MPKIATLEQRFWEKVDRGSPDECWLWNASVLNSGYGQIRDGHRRTVTGHYRMITAHKLSWELHHGSIPRGKYVLHKCDNKRCVNPNHLYLGTQSDNMCDKVMRNPQGLGGRIGKLSNLDVKFIRLLYKIGLTHSKIAQEFNVSRSTISSIIGGKAYVFV